MTDSKDPFLIRWHSLHESERRFLMVAYEWDKRLPHSDGFDKVLPALKWRTVGALCGLRAHESDDVVRRLSDAGLVLVLSDEERKIGLISRLHIWEMLEAQRRRRWNWIALAAGVLGAAASLVVHW